MKRIKSIALCAIFAVLSVFPVTGCGSEDATKTLYIDISNAGYGIEWLDPLKEIYESEHDGITVKIRSAVKNDGAYVNKFLSGVADTDLFIVETDVLSKVNTPVNANGQRYEIPFEDITDLYNEKIPGENVTVAEKMRPEYYEFNTYDGRNYTFPWVESMMGIVMNKNVYRESWGKLPNTTKELIAFCDKVKEDGISPFICSYDDPYWLDIYDVWMAQYNGRADMERFYDGYTLSGQYAGERYIPEMFLDRGLEEALNVLDTLVNADNGYHSDLSYTLSFTAVQNKFLDATKDKSKKDQFLFMIDGSWLQREMEQNFEPDEINTVFVRIPVVSVLGDKLGITDETLSEIIDYADGTVSAAPDFVSSKGIDRQEVIDKVTEARCFAPSNHLHAAFIPVYGNKKDLAKDFIRLMASDRGIEAMMKKSQIKPPMKYDVEANVEISVSSFMESFYDIAAASDYTIFKQGALFRRGGLKLINGAGYFTYQLSAKSINDRKSGAQIFAMNYDYVKQTERWDTYLANAGITIDE